MNIIFERSVDNSVKFCPEKSKIYGYINLERLMTENRNLCHGLCLWLSKTFLAGHQKCMK